MAQLKIGDRAPDFALTDQRGETIRLSDFRARGRKLLVFFYPAAGTSGCTLQSRSVRDARSELNQLGVDAVGISPDPPTKQRQFDTENSLGFPLLSDQDHAVAEAWGAWGERTTSTGERKVGILRSSFVVDEDGRIVQASYAVSPNETVPNALAALR